MFFGLQILRNFLRFTNYTRT